MERQKYEKHFIKNDKKIKELKVKFYELAQLRMITRGKLIFEDFNKLISKIQEDIYLLEEEQKFFLRKVLSLE
jgi:hypothetical protein